MGSSEYQRDGSVVVTGDDGVRTTLAAAPQSTLDAAIQAFLANHAIAVPLPSDDPRIIAALQGATLAKALKWLVNKRVLTLDDLV